MCFRNTQYYEKVSDPLDLSTIEKQILTGHYKTVEAFDTDMLKVFRNAEVGFHSDNIFLRACSPLFWCEFDEWVALQFGMNLHLLASEGLCKYNPHHQILTKTPKHLSALLKMEDKCCSAGLVKNRSIEVWIDS